MSNKFRHIYLVVVLSLLASSITRAQDDLPNFRGVWKTSYVSRDDPRWLIVDLACSGWCSLPAYNYLKALLQNPENDERLVQDLLGEAQEYGNAHLANLLTPLALEKQGLYDPANDPAVDCTPDGDGLRHQITAPIPVEFKQDDDKIVIQYEYWNAVRTIHLDGRTHPSDGINTRLGHSIGWFEDSTLVVETAQIIPSLIRLPGGYIRHSSDALLIERYTRSGDRLDLIWEIVDPMHFRKPYRGQKSLLLAPDWELDVFNCDAITGEF